MKSPTVEQLNKEFAFQNNDNSLGFKAGEGDITLIEVTNSKASATISLQGAHVLSWKPNNQTDVIWLSKDATFSKGKSVRGGVPVCWPWFGAHESNTSYPAHGFARTVIWQVNNTQQLDNGETQISFILETQQLDEKYQEMWPQNTIAQYTMTIGDELKIELTTINKSEQPITIGQALHTYFNVEDITTTTVQGLEGVTYRDKTDDFKKKKQMDSLIVNEEVDRVYLRTSDDVTIQNKNRKIIIKKQGSESTVVWNPWRAVAEKMGDLGKDGYINMLCVESANALDDVREIKPGGSHTLAVSYELMS